MKIWLFALGHFHEEWRGQGTLFVTFFSYSQTIHPTLPAWPADKIDQLNLSNQSEQAEAGIQTELKSMITC